MTCFDGFVLQGAAALECLASGAWAMASAACIPGLCRANYRVQTGACVRCGPGTTRDAGDDAALGDTACDAARAITLSRAYADVAADLDGFKREFVQQVSGAGSPSPLPANPL